MFLRQALEETRAPRSEHAANLSLWDTHQRAQGHPPIPSWQVPAPARNRQPKARDWDGLREFLQGARYMAAAVAIVAVICLPYALHMG